MIGAILIGKCFHHSVLPLPALAQQGYRLTGGPTQYWGTVEVLRNGQWQTVCDNGWDFTEGNLVCRLLGYGSAISVYTGALFGEGAGNIWVRDWLCTGRENSLEDCPPGVSIGCSNSEAAGVSCFPPTTLNPTSTSGTTSTSESATVTPPLGDTTSGGLPSYAWYIIGVVGFLLVVGCLVCTGCITWSICMACCCSGWNVDCSACESCCPWECRCGRCCKNSVKMFCKPCKICCSNLKFCMNSCGNACGRCLMASGKACCLPFVLCGRCIKTGLITVGRNIQLCCHNMARCLVNCCRACFKPIVRCLTNLGQCIKAAFISCGKCIQSCVTKCCTPCVLCCTAMGNCTKCMCAALGSFFKACGRGSAACCYYAWICLCCPCIVFCSDKETVQQYKQDIANVCTEVPDEEAGVGDQTIDNAATVGGGCEGCILNMQSSVQSFCRCTYTEESDINQ